MHVLLALLACLRFLSSTGPIMQLVAAFKRYERPLLFPSLKKLRFACISRTVSKAKNKYTLHTIFDFFSVGVSELLLIFGTAQRPPIVVANLTLNHTAGLRRATCKAQYGSPGIESSVATVASCCTCSNLTRKRTLYSVMITGGLGPVTPYKRRETPVKST